jgi:asparagine synthase (glutamine-hydrolysing)
MCGIFGALVPRITNFDNLYSSGMLLKSRGPERQRIYQTDKLFLMFHRLCIINKSNKGDGPFQYSNGNQTYFVLCNGEIYNYKNIKKSFRLKKQTNDTSYIFPLFNKFKRELNVSDEEAFKLLNQNITGSEYSIVIVKCIDNIPVNMYLSVDTSSVRPLFYSFDEENNTFYFSSLLKGLTNITECNKQNIRRLDGGKMIKLSLDDKQNIQFALSSYTINLPYTIISNDINIVKKNIVTSLIESVEKRCQSDRELGCLLSGGLDSSLVASIASRYMKRIGKKLRTFTIGMKNGTDLKYAKLVADHIDSIHTEILFTPEEGLAVLEDVIKTTETYDITTIRASVGQYLIGKWISENTDIKVLLNGDGADEIQCGYLYFHNAPTDKELHEESIKLIDNIHLYDGLRVDRCISNFGLEARIPFLDHDLVTIYRNMDPSLKKPYKNIEKYLIRQAFLEYDSNFLPESVLWRTKEAFSDGVSTKEDSWYIMVKKYTEQFKTVDIDKVYYHVPPVSHESRWFREVFEKEFGTDVAHVIPYYWLPNFVNSTEPSGRELKIYKNLNTELSS